MDNAAMSSPAISAVSGGGGPRAPGPRLRPLFLAPFEPWCRENGSSLVIADLLQGLATIGGAEILPVFLRDAPAAGCAAAPPGLEGIKLGADGLPKWVSAAGAMLTGRSPTRMRFASRRLARRIIREVQARGFQPTLVHVEHLAVVDTGLRLAREFRCPLVYRAHNIESQLWARRLTTGGPLRQWLLRRSEQQEADAMATAGLTLCISNVDLAWVRSHAAGANAELLPGCLAFGRYEAHRRSVTMADRQVCFVGGLEWAPNERGLRWFVESVLPRMAARVPTAKLAVLARGADARPWLVENPSIRLMPGNTVPATLFAASAASIAPLLQGGGVRIKILESLAVGCPVVATGIGCEGLDLPGLTTADSAEAFADGCVRHVDKAADPNARRALAEAARTRHDAEVVAGKLVAAWSRVALRSTTTPGARLVG